jgi:type IV secretory pathway VirB2 component (pilin)
MILLKTIIKLLLKLNLGVTIMLNFKLSSDNAWQICLLFCLTAAILVLPEISLAGDTDDGISTVLCKIVTKLTGPIGKAIGVTALATLGIGIFMGKLQWQLALSVALGITFIFSAGKIINWLSGTGTNSC